MGSIEHDLAQCLADSWHRVEGNSFLLQQLSVSLVSHP